MKRKFLKTILCLAVLALALSCAGRPAQADSLYVRKIVSVVLDDSSSMSGDRWNYAVYALQNLAALLNPGDTLLVTRLNQSGTVQYDITDAGLDASILKLRSQPGASGGTPFKSVVEAFQQLKNRKNTDALTEYWLMILTDGEFQKFNATKYGGLKEAVDDFLQQQMPNGGRPKVVYLNIAGDGKLKSDADRGLYSYSASNSGEINATLAGVSDFVTGRKRFDRSDYQIVDGQTIRISSDIPLANIILLQNSDAKVVSVQSDQNQQLTVTRSAETYQPIGIFTALSSTISRVEFLAGNIAAGTYTVTYDRAFKPEDLTVLFEPALEIRLIADADGRQLDRAALPAVYAGDLLTATYQICESGTQVEIPLSIIPGAKAGITVSDNINSRTDSPEIKWPLSASQTQVTAWLDIPGFRRLEDTLILNPGKKPPMPGTDPVEDMTLTIGQYRHTSPGIIVTNYLIQYDESGNTQTKTELTTRQELIDNKITVETQLPYDRNVLYGSDGKLHLDFYDDGTVTTGTWRVTVIWDGNVLLEFHIIITPSTFTLEAVPPELTVTLGEFLSSPQTIQFRLLEDGLWPASCRDHELEISSELPGSLAFDADGNGVFTFSRDPKPVWGDYRLTPSLRHDTLTGPAEATVHLTRSAADIRIEPDHQLRRQSETGNPAVFTARMLIDGVAVPFEKDRFTVVQDELKDRMTADLQADGSLTIRITPGLDLQPGLYPLEVRAENGAGQAELEIAASVFTITPDISSLSLVTDDLPDNQRGIRFLIEADGRPLTEEEIRRLNPRFDQGLLPDGQVTYEDGAAVYTPHAPQDWTLLPDGVYPVVCTLPDGTQASADVVLTMIKYEILAVRDGQTVSRESLVGSNEAVVFEIRRDGQKMTAEEILALGFSLSTDDRHRSWVELNGTVSPNGEVEVVPSRSGWKLIASFAPLGELPVTLTVKVTPGTARMFVRRGDFWEEWLPYRIVPAFILQWLLGYLFKWGFLRKKFRYRSAVYLCDCLVAKGGDIRIEDSSWSQYCRLFCLRMLFPWIRDRKRIKGTDICLEAAGGTQLRYLIRPHDDYEHYYTADLGEIQPYESGLLALNTLEEIDPEEDEEESSRRKKKAKWHSLGVGTCIVRYDGDQYSIYSIKS